MFPLFVSLPQERGKVDATRFRRKAPCPISPMGRLLDQRPADRIGNDLAHLSRHVTRGPGLPLRSCHQSTTLVAGHQ
jgi:hypothetical protein